MERTVRGERGEGVHDDVLAERYGVSARRIRWHRRRRALKAGLEPPDRRRRPPEGWPADRVHPQSGMTPDARDELLGRQQAGGDLGAGRRIRTVRRDHPAQDRGRRSAAAQPRPDDGA